LSSFSQNSAADFAAREDSFSDCVQKCGATSNFDSAGGDKSLMRIRAPPDDWRGPPRLSPDHDRVQYSC